MNNSIIHSGYSGLYSSPFEYKKPQNPCLFWSISTTARDIFLIPLTSGFFNTAFNILKDVSFRRVHVICPMLNIYNISDIFNLYQNVCNGLEKNMTIYVNKIDDMIDLPEYFRKDIVITNGATIAYGDNDQYPFSFSYFNSEDPESAWTPKNVLVYDGYSRMLFVNKMTEELAREIKFEKGDMFDKIHMPLVNRSYGGLSYFDLVKLDSWFTNKCVMNQFSNDVEEEFCDERKLEKGEVIF